jgi:DNA-binding beta-propeller fold protein YncE
VRLVVALALVASVATACGSDDPVVTRIEIDGNPSAVTFTDGKVWVADDENHAVHAIDRETNKIVGEPIEVERNPIAITREDEDVWVAHASGWLVRIDGSPPGVADRVRTKGSLTGVAATDGHVWATDLERDRLVEVDPERREITDSIRVGPGAVRVAVGLRGLFVTGRENVVTRIPFDDSDPTRFTVGQGPIGVASYADEVWVANSDDGTVSEVDGDGPAIEVGRGPVALAFTPDQTMCVANQDDSSLSIVRDGEQVDVVDLGTSPRDVTSDGEDCWVAGTNPSAVVRVGL